MKNRNDVPRTIPASATERASIRALKHWLLSGPGESPLQDQIVRLRIADAIARFAPGKLVPKTAKRKRRIRGAAKA
jgi:hypothetical protein